MTQKSSEEMAESYRLTQTSQYTHEYIAQLGKQVRAGNNEELIVAYRCLKNAWENFGKILVAKGLGH